MLPSEMKTWDDIDRCVSNGTLGKQDIETLREFSQVPPEPSNNPIYHRHYEAAMASIRELIREKDAKYSADQTAKTTAWEQPGWKMILTVFCGVILFLILAFLKHLFPSLK